jgi:hypothetical protein
LRFGLETTFEHSTNVSPSYKTRVCASFLSCCFF